MDTLHINGGYLLYPDLSIAEVTPSNEYMSGINHIRSLDRYRGYPVDKVKVNMNNVDDIRYRRIKLELSSTRLTLLDKTPLMAPIPDGDDVRYILGNHNIYIVNDKFYYDIDDIPNDDVDDKFITWNMSTSIIPGNIIDIQSIILDNGIITNTNVEPTLTLFSLYLGVEVDNINLLDYNYPLPPNMAKDILRDSVRVIKEIHRYINNNYTDPVYIFIDNIVNSISNVEKLSDTDRSQLRTLLSSMDMYRIVKIRNILHSNYSIDIKKDLIDKFIQYITADTFSPLQYELRDELTVMLSLPDKTKKLLSDRWISLDKIKDLQSITEDKRLSLIEKYGQLRKYGLLDKNFHRLRDKINHEIHSVDLIDRIHKSQLPNYIKDKLLAESRYISDNDDSDSIKKRQWIETCLKLPTTVKSPPISLGDNINKIQEFKKSLKQHLNQKVYGMKSVKKLVIDYIFKVLTNPNSINHHLALCGPKGVGKTYLAQVISEVLDRPLVRVNLGGCHDGSKLVGHSYTYVGSIPGDIIQGLIRSRIMNPIFLLDEVDKISQRHNNEINGILIHLLDPIQNHEFTDEYLGFSYDVSKILWILSFNHVNNIDPILVDRLHVIHIRGYSRQEKLEMSTKYIIPSVESNLGYKKPLNISQEAIRYIVGLTDNDEGVRRLKHLIEMVWTRVNRWIVIGKIRGDDVVSIDMVQKILRDDIVTSDRTKLTYFI
jgi:ATP-dependent Lon protease